MQFETGYDAIIAQVHQIDPIAYGRSRNYLDGAVTRLSPYISRGVISTKQIAEIVLAKGYDLDQIERFLQELAWRDYFQRVWMALGDDINNDIKQPQPNVEHNGIPEALTNANTRITAVDRGIHDLKTDGYLHNHLRMYVASIACNVGRSYWLAPAKWMYYYLLDADWASNALSWQWVAGSFSKKKYFANQENINKYCATQQSNTFLDVAYEELPNLNIPEVLQKQISLSLKTLLPEGETLKINQDLPSYIYNFYNLAPNWDNQIDANRILLLAPSFFEQYPVCENTINFILKLAKNIEGIQIYVGEFDELADQLGGSTINYKEHPTNKHYIGIAHPRDWMVKEVEGNYPSFFAFWKKCKPHLKANFTKA